MFRRVFAVVACTLMLFGAPSLVAAQSAGTAVGNTYVTQTTGEQVTWKSPWVFSKSISKRTADGELIGLQNGPTAFLIGYFPNSPSLVSARDDLLARYPKGVGGIQNLDGGTSSGISYSLDKGTNQGASVGIFTLDLGDTGHGATVVYTFVAPVDSFSAKMNSAQTKITIAGAAVLQGVTPDGLQAALGSNPTTASSAASNATTTPGAASQASQPDPRASYQQIDVRDLDIHTDRFVGKKVTVSGTVFNIQAQGDFTGMQIWVDAPDGSQVPVIVGYYGDSSGIYNGTAITVYGVCTGRVSGTNSFGGDISQPAIAADIVDH